MTETDPIGPIETAIADGRTTLTEAESKTVLDAVGVKTPPHEVVGSADDAVDAADRLGYPVVVKVSSPAVQHKSEWANGAGVALGVESANGVRSATDRVLTTASEREIDAEVLVESAVDIDAGTEVIVGGLRDPSFGPTVLVGLGGVFTEVFEDTSPRLAPIDDAEAHSAIEELRSARVLHGYRGQPAADVEALARTVRTVGDLLIEHESITEIDLNPVLAGSDGALALDALVVLGEGV